jgi:hypothetical protein
VQTSQKSQHNTRGSQFVTKRINTDKYRNSCLQAALRKKRDVYKNKYTNPRLAEVTTDKYQVEIQTIKLTKHQNLKRLQVSKTRQDTTENSDMVTCDKCGKTFKKRGLKLHTTLKHATVSNKTE